MNIFDPPLDVGTLRRKATMHDEEMQTLDRLVKIIAPALVVESGTEFGGSAALMARYVPVITIDRAPVPDPGVFSGLPVKQIIGKVPDILDEKIAPEVKGKRWIYFHDSNHSPEFVDAEFRWAVAHGASAFLWHDFAHCRMPEFVERLNERQFYPIRTCSPESSPDWKSFTGIGLCWIR